jgi:hypothetical protein
VSLFIPGNKKQLTLRLDPDVVDYFKRLGRGYKRMCGIDELKGLSEPGFIGSKDLPDYNPNNFTIQRIPIQTDKGVVLWHSMNIFPYIAKRCSWLFIWNR